MNNKENYLPEVIIESLSENFKMPEYAKDGDSGMDVFSTVDVTIVPGATAIIPLDFKIEIPKHPKHDLGYRWEIQVRPRSGISAKTPIRVANAPGTIDNGYINGVGVILSNTASPHYFSNEIDGETEVAMSDYVSDLKNVKSLNMYDDFVVPTPDGTYFIHKGDKIAQLVFNEVIRPLKLTIGQVTTVSDRQGGFGHTGI